MIRKAKKTKEEIESIYQLIAQGAAEHSILPRSMQEIAEVIDSFFVAVEDGKIVGCSAIEIYNQKLAEVRSLVVLSEYQGRGIGGELVKACVEVARKKGALEVITITDKDAFFERNGFNKFLNGQWAMFIKFR